MTNGKLYAFWSYDFFPYLCGGEVTKIMPKGAVETKEFGSGHHFHPVQLLPIDEGRELKLKLEALTKKRKASEALVNAEYRKQLAELLGEYKGLLVATKNGGG